MNGEVTGMPRLQLIRDFFCELEGPYTVIELTASAAKERIERLELLACGDRFGYFSALIEYFIESAKVLECRRYRTDVELVRYAVREYLVQRNEWSASRQLVVKYNAGGELLAYTFDPAERQPMEVWADICEGDPENPRKMHYPEQTVKWEDVLDFAWGEKDGGGVLVAEDGGDASCVSSWDVSKDDTERFSVEWWPCGFERLRMEATTESRKEMVEFLRKYMRGGLSEAQQCFVWSPVYDRLGTIEFADEAQADVMRAKRHGQDEVLDTFRLLGIGRVKCYSMLFEHKKAREIVSLIKNRAKDCDYSHLDRSEYIPWLVLFYLAMRGDKDSCKKLALHFKNQQNMRLCNYWRKCAGQSELKPRTHCPRQKKPSNQLEFQLGV